MNKLILLAIIIALGYGYYYHREKVRSAANETIDTAVRTAIEGVDKISPAYYYKNRSYGKIATKTICSDTTSATSVGAVIHDIERYTKAVSCRTDTSFPAKSFTIVAPSFTNKNQYYCTDQSGYVGLIPDITAKNTPFKAGFACK